MSITKEELAAEIYQRGCGQIEDYDQSEVVAILAKTELCVQEMADILIYGEDK